jgi:hypothetical protein
MQVHFEECERLLLDVQLHQSFLGDCKNEKLKSDQKRQDQHANGTD